MTSIALEDQVGRSTAQRTLGRQGLSIWGGHVHEEYLTQLHPWSKAVRVYLEMRDDVTIGTLLDAVKMPLLKAPITVSPASDAAADQEAAAFLQWNLEHMDRQTLRSLLDAALECLDFGFFIGEIVMEKLEAGQPWPGKLRIKNVEPRGQETLRRWGTDPEQLDRVTAFIQGQFRGSRIGEERVIPLDKCLHIVFRGRKGDPQGRALLRSLYRPWKFLKNVEMFEGIGIERDTGGTPVFTMPEGAEYAESSSEFQLLEDQAEGLRVDERAFVILPHGTELTAYAGGSKSFDTDKVINRYKKDILMRFFAQFLTLGMEQVGTQALVEGSQDFFSMGLRSTQEVVIEAINDQLVPYLFRFNRFPIKDLPVVQWGDPGRVDPGKLIDAYSTGVTARLITPKRDDEVAIREALALPELQDDEGNDSREAPAQPAPGGFPANPLATLAARAARYAEQNPDLRTLGGVYEDFQNRYQQELVSVYEAWAQETEYLAGLPGRTTASTATLVDARLSLLATDLKMAGRSAIGHAARLGLKGPLAAHADRAAVNNLVSRLIAENDTNVDTLLIPHFRERFAEGLPAATRAGGLGELLEARTAAVAQHSGHAWAAIFEGQVVAGREENADREAAGLPLIPVRWSLDPNAEHCADDAGRGTFGCPELARVYAGGWDDLPTVPAGNVSCLGNCRCALEADFGNGWERIT